MTTSNIVLSSWATRPLGRAARLGIAFGGMAISTVLLTVASVVTTGSWALILLGVGLTAASVRAARVPTAGRLSTMAAALIVVPFLLNLS